MTKYNIYDDETKQLIMIVDISEEEARLMAAINGFFIEEVKE